MSNGKGSAKRPTNLKVFDANYDEISKIPEINKNFKLVKVKGKLVQRKVYK